MPFEVELKFRAVDRAALVARLASLGALPAPALAHEDTYLAHPCRDFARTNEAFRVRRIGDETRLTYKGPKHPGETKTREEIELPVTGAGDERVRLLRLFERLGFTPVATIRKLRTPFRVDFAGRILEVAIDAAEGLGDFAEVETLAADTPDLPAAQAAVRDCARALALSEVEPRSYLRMALERAASAPA
jgi:adenylate cyclase class 2